MRLTVFVLWLAACAHQAAPVQSADPAVRLEQYLAAGHSLVSFHDERVLQAALSQEQATHAVTLATQARREALHAQRAPEMAARVLSHDEFDLRIWMVSRGDSPFGERPLYISLHGGGGAPAAVNDEQWVNQQTLYAPDDGIYVAPRAPTDTWNLWHRPEMDVFVDRLIEDMVAVHGADPNRVYLTGYSAGGDGVFQLGWHLADRFAAINPNAGHPNDSHPNSMRNVPITIHMGGEDAAYGRNAVAAQWRTQLASLQADDPDGYIHHVAIHDGLPHWMNGEEKVALPWMAQFVRRHSEPTVVWDVRQARSGNRFYWLGLHTPAAHDGSTIRAEIEGNRIVVTSTPPVEGLELWLDDTLVDLDATVTVEHNGVVVFEQTPERTIQAVIDSLLSPGAPFLPRTAHLRLESILR